MPGSQIIKKAQKVADYREHYYGGTPAALLPPEICDMITEYLLDEETGYELLDVYIGHFPRRTCTEFSFWRTSYMDFDSMLVFNTPNDGLSNVGQLLKKIGKTPKTGLRYFGGLVYVIDAVVMDTHLKTITFRHKLSFMKFIATPMQMRILVSLAKVDMMHQSKANS
jgi:hypothetical protein